MSTFDCLFVAFFGIGGGIYTFYPVVQQHRERELRKAEERQRLVAAREAAASAKGDSAPESLSLSTSGSAAVATPGSAAGSAAGA